MNEYERMQRIEQEIKKKELLARQAFSKGMNAVYRNYLSDIMELKRQLNKLLTDPHRQ